MKEIVTLWCEWDMGFQKYFDSEQSGMEYLKEKWTQDVSNGVSCTLDEALEEGLVGFGIEQWLLRK